jgi:hypothetical protein
MKQSVLVTGFCGFGYSLERRGWGVDTHSTFTRRPQGSFAAAKNVLRPFQFAKSRTATAFQRFLFRHVSLFT